MKDKQLTVIIPAYNESANIRLAAETIGVVLQGARIPYRLLFVDDGSRDDTWEQIEACALHDPEVSGLHFSRNFGKESAIFAGLRNVSTGCAVVMDADLQHPPEKLVTMYRLWEEGYEIVEGVKVSRGEESSLKKKTAGAFYSVIGKLTGLEMENTSDFKLLDEKVIRIVAEMPERNTFFRALSFWTGFRSVKMEYEVQARVNGTTKWSLLSLLRYALNNIVVFSTMPMQLVTFLGALCVFLGVIFGIISLTQYMMGLAVTGFTTVILLLVIIGGFVMISLGIIGVYIAHIYSEVQHRPRYLISEVCGEMDEDGFRPVG